MVLFGQAISDPIALLGKVEGAWGIAAALVGLSLATLTTNLAANVVAPANAAVSVAPGRFTFISGALLTSVAGAAVKPWRLIESTSTFYAWLVSRAGMGWLGLLALGCPVPTRLPHLLNSPTHPSLLPPPPPSLPTLSLPRQVGYSVVLGPIAGIMLADYYALRGRQLDLDALYRCREGQLGRMGAAGGGSWGLDLWVLQGLGWAGRAGS